MKKLLCFGRLAILCLVASAFCCMGGCTPDTVVSGSGQGAPEITDPAAEGILTQGQSAKVTVSAIVVAVDDAGMAVVADLTEIGGSSNQWLVQRSSRSLWSWTGTVTPAVAGLRSVTITATDALGLSDSATTHINVLPSDSPPPQPDPDPVVPIRGVQKNPLGQSTNLLAPNIGMVYVPSRYGGQLSLSGGDVQLLYANGAAPKADASGRVSWESLGASVVANGDPCVYTVPEGSAGWYYIRLTQSGSATIASTFVEEGQASSRPWNGWWWPWNASAGPTLYASGGPLDKYDEVHGTKARGWDVVNEVGGAWWWGHCWGWSIASILLPEPKAAAKNGVSFTQDDMKALYVHLADNQPYVDQSLSVAEIPPGPPTIRTGESVDSYCDDVHRVLRACIRDDRVPIQADLRAVSIAADRADEIWNHAIYRYVAFFREAPGTDNERIVEIDMQIWANYDLDPPPADRTSARREEYIYRLEFDAQGQVVSGSPNQNWISASHFAPNELHRITGSPWASHNPYITKARIDSLYQR